MRNKIICILFAAVLCMILCGCGMDQTGNRPGTNDMDILPDVTPMISPDTQDGVVNDHDGIIGNSHTDGADHDDNGNDSMTGGTNGTSNGGTNSGTNGTSNGGANGSTNGGTNGSAGGGTNGSTNGGTNGTSPTTAPGTSQNP